MKIISVVGARPNFMKVSALHRVFSQHSEIESIIVHTGQHYDEKMSTIFFDELEMSKPDHYLGVGSGSHAEVTAKVMVAFEKVVLEEKPDLVLVVGDINSTLACGLVASKLHIKLAHVEAGLRSGDRKMPEEINRIVTDSISDLLFVTEKSGLDNLKKEGVSDDKVFFTGNVMIDSLIHYKDKVNDEEIMRNHDLSPREYILMTMHRPANVDQKESLIKVVDIIAEAAKRKKVVFPIHPRTAHYLKKYDLLGAVETIDNVLLLPPLGYLEFLSLMKNAAIVLTDSGGIQEETTYLKIPCLTLRDSTERPSTVDIGSNVLIPVLDQDLIMTSLDSQLSKSEADYEVPPYWDGVAAQRILEVLIKAKG